MEDKLIRLLERIATALERSNELHEKAISSNEAMSVEDRASRDRLIHAVEESAGQGLETADLKPYRQ